MPSFRQSVLKGSLGFGLASLVVFASVAFGERWMYERLGLLGAYLVWTALFIILGGGALGTLVTGAWRLPRFFLLFAIAFFFYAAGWFVAYFSLRGAVGEWVGSIAGSILMAGVIAIGFRAVWSLLRLSLLLFVANSLGYFLGSVVNDYIGGRPGMLVWGAIYGLFLGAGLGGALQLAQVGREPLPKS